MVVLTATAAEARLNFSKIAAQVSQSGSPVTVFKNSRPWVTINPVGEDSNVRSIDWGALDVVGADPKTGRTVLPAEWDDPADEGLYDDFV